MATNLNDLTGYEEKKAFRDALAAAKGDLTWTQLAERMGIGPITLNNRINPDQPNQFTVPMLIAALRRCPKPGEFLAWLAKQYGHSVFELPKPEELTGLANLFKEMTKLAAEAGDVPNELLHAMEDGRIDRGERQRLEREIHQMIQAGMRLLAAINHHAT